MMWKSLSNSIASFGSKKNLAELDRASDDFSDDETSSNASTNESLECPICWESFNIVENVPYVLWCGHTLCKNCVLGLRCASVKFSTQQIQIPFFVSCPWCNLLTFRLVYKGALKFPSKNFFLLWMVESKNGDRTKFPSSICRDHQQVWPQRCTSAIGNPSISHAQRRMHRIGQTSSSNNGNYNNDSRDTERTHMSLHNYNNDSRDTERTHMSLHKSLDLLFRVTAKFPLVILLLIVLFALPTCAGILVLYLVITVLFALPAFLVLYFVYPTLQWLGREIQN